MSGAPMVGGDFNSRLQAALAKAKSSAPATGGSAIVVPSASPPGRGENFSERLAKALSKAKGDPASADAVAEEPSSGGPVGQGDYVVREGDCISSIARDHGLFWKTIWDDPGNSELVEVRKDPNVLLAGDRLTVPEKTRKDESISAEARHRFKRKGEPSKLAIQIKQNGEIVANRPFTLKIDGHEPIAGTTDSAGYVRTSIPGNAEKAELIVGDPGSEFTYELELGAIAPVSELKGVQRRLRSLGYAIDRIDGEPSEATMRAILAFQAACGLPETGSADQGTQGALRTAYGG